MRLALPWLLGAAGVVLFQMLLNALIVSPRERRCDKRQHHGHVDGHGYCWDCMRKVA